MIPELVVPAGSFDALRAAVNNGADAVYLGGKKFNARVNAKNFYLNELKHAINYAHDQQVNVYVTVNTLVADRELSELIQYLGILDTVEVDAIIIQDLGIMKICREIYPTLKLHASTQATVYNTAGVQFLSNEGVKRVILARELSIDEIRKIKEECNTEVEVFLHGALCFSYSGQCLLSSFIGGRSANRGNCASPCRLPFSIVNRNGSSIKSKGNHVLSMKDLNLSKNIDELVSANIDAVKIEGRMKRPEYVAIVTKIYRTLIDEGLRKPTSLEKRNLEAIFNREFTTNCFYGNNFSEVINCERPGNYGTKIGVVTNYDFNSKIATVNFSEDTFVGDGLEFNTISGPEGFFIKELFLKGEKIKKAPANLSVDIFLPFKPILKSFIRKTHDSIMISKARKTFQVGQQEKKYDHNDSKMSINKTIGQQQLSSLLTHNKNKIRRIPKICAEVETIESLQEALRANVSEVYFGNLTKNPSKDLDQYKEAILMARENKTPISIVLPQIMKDENHSKKTLTNLVEAGATKFLVGDLGVFGLVNEIGQDVYLDSSFNIFNKLTRDLLFNYTPRITLSQELHLNQIARIAGGAPGEIEYIVHGPISLMISKHCPISNIYSQKNKNFCRTNCDKSGYYLKDRKEAIYPFWCDHLSNIHIMHSKEICLIEHIPELKDAGVTVFRIRCQFHRPNNIGNLIKLYGEALSLNIGESDNYSTLASLKKKILDLSDQDLTAGKLYTGVE